MRSVDSDDRVHQKRYLEPRVIVALDYASSKQALEFVSRISPKQCRLKIGLELYTAAGPTIIEAIHNQGFQVFLDLKFHDIPNTVAKACAQAAKLGVWMVNVHTLGGRSMLAAARAAMVTVDPAPLLLGVTILTSHSQEDISEIGLPGDVEKNVTELALLARTSGLDGVVCSGWEAKMLREKMGRDFILVTPGVRPEHTKPGDQVRVMTPEQAIEAGSDYLVVGRPITQAKDPALVLDEINQRIR